MNEKQAENFIESLFRMYDDPDGQIGLLQHLNADDLSQVELSLLGQQERVAIYSNTALRSVWAVISGRALEDEIRSKENPSEDLDIPF